MERATVGALAAGLSALLLVGCSGNLQAEPRGPSPTPTGPTRLVGVGMVLDDGSGPELCLGAVAASHPPQCGGPPLVGWHWPKAGVERAAGVTWVNAAVLGTYDGKRFTVEKTVDPDTVEQPRSPDPDWRTPCPAPAGGWRAPEPDRATAEDQERVFSAADRLPGFAGSWIDDLGDTRQDPAKVVVNVRVTGNIAAAEKTLRKVWAGSLCVSPAKRSQADLLHIIQSVVKGDAYVGGFPGHDRVDVEVIYDDGTLQRKLDKEYGKGLIYVTSALQPYAG